MPELKRIYSIFFIFFSKHVLRVFIFMINYHGICYSFSSLIVNFIFRPGSVDLEEGLEAKKLKMAPPASKEKRLIPLTVNCLVALIIRRTQKNV